MSFSPDPHGCFEIVAGSFLEELERTRTKSCEWASFSWNHSSHEAQTPVEPRPRVTFAAASAAIDAAAFSSASSASTVLPPSTPVKTKAEDVSATQQFLSQPRIALSPKLPIIGSVYFIQRKLPTKQEESPETSQLLSQCLEVDLMVKDPRVLLDYVSGECSAEILLKHISERFACVSADTRKQFCFVWRLKPQKMKNYNVFVRSIVAAKLIWKQACLVTPDLMFVENLGMRRGFDSRFELLKDWFRLILQNSKLNQTKTVRPVLESTVWFYKTQKAVLQHVLLRLESTPSADAQTVVSLRLERVVLEILKFSLEAMNEGRPGTPLTPATTNPFLSPTTSSPRFPDRYHRSPCQAAPYSIRHEFEISTHAQRLLRLFGFPSSEQDLDVKKQNPKLSLDFETLQCILVQTSTSDKQEAHSVEVHGIMPQTSQYLEYEQLIRKLNNLSRLVIHSVKSGQHQFKLTTITLALCTMPFEKICVCDQVVLFLLFLYLQQSTPWHEYEKELVALEKNSFEAQKALTEAAKLWYQRIWPSVKLKQLVACKREVTSEQQQDHKSQVQPMEIMRDPFGSFEVFDMQDQQDPCLLQVHDREHQLSLSLRELMQNQLIKKPAVLISAVLTETTAKGQAGRLVNHLETLVSRFA